MKKIRILLCIIFCLFIFPYTASAEDMEVTLFDSNITVNKNRTLKIKEQYKLYFVKDTEQFTRTLNKNVIIDRPNGSKLLTDIKISNVKSSAKIVSNEKSDSKNIIMTVDGIQDETSDYNLKYTYNLGKDYLSGSDEVYYDIVNNIDAPISNLTFSITLPDTIDEDKIKFVIDGNYNISNDDVSYNIENNVLTGTYNKLLKNNQTFSVYITLPDNYFVGSSDNFNYMIYLILIIPFIGMILLIAFWIKYGKGNKLKIKRVDKIPNDFDSAEIGYIYKGFMEEMDLTSLVLYLATKGYLQIIEHDDGYKLGKENSFKFIKLKDYDKNNAAQELICNELFRNRDVTNLSDIEYHFADTFKEAKSMLDNVDNYKKFFFGTTRLAKLVSMIMIFLSVLVVNFKPIYLLTNSYLLTVPISLLIFFGIYIVFMANMTGIKKLFGIIILLGSLYVGIYPVLIQQQLLIISSVGIALILLMCILYSRLSERTKYGNKMLSDVYGFKYYLETLSKKELEDKINQDSNYFIQ